MRFRAAIFLLACAPACLADSLTLRTGQVIQGTYMGGTSRTVKMQVDDSVTTYDVTDIASLQFTPPAASASARRAPSPPVHSALAQTSKPAPERK